MESVSQEGAKEGNGGGEMLEGNLRWQNNYSYSFPAARHSNASSQCSSLPYRARVQYSST